MFFHGNPSFYSKTQASDERLIKFKTYNGRKNYSMTESGIEGGEWQRGRAVVKEKLRLL